MAWCSKAHKAKALYNYLASAMVLSEQQLCVQGRVLIVAYRYNVASKHAMTKAFCCNPAYAKVVWSSSFAVKVVY